MANIPRSQAKTINLGLFYGMGKNKLQAELGVSKENADEVIEFSKESKHASKRSNQSDAFVSFRCRKAILSGVIPRRCKKE